MKEKITVTELRPDGTLVKHTAVQWRKNKRPGRKPKRTAL